MHAHMHLLQRLKTRGAPVLSDGIPSINEALLRDVFVFHLWEANPFDLVFEFGFTLAYGYGRC